jgi:hypothetical protein
MKFLGDNDPSVQPLVLDVISVFIDGMKVETHIPEICEFVLRMTEKTGRFLMEVRSHGVESSERDS